ncbi:hypothetical protein INT45_010767, partial [Circinella minor]
MVSSINLGPNPINNTSTSTPLLSKSTNNSSKHLPLPYNSTQSRRSSMSTTTTTTITSIDDLQTPLKSKRSDDNIIKFASTKRNIEFHTLFKSVPESDHLMNDYGCALQKEILIQGRMYISGSHICFNANIFGWVTNLVIDFTDIIEIEKRTTAIFIPNAIQISTSQAKYFFASFLSRDQAYDHITQLWRESQRKITESPHSDLTRVGSDYDDDHHPLTDDSMSSLSDDTENSIEEDQDNLFLQPTSFSPPTTTKMTHPSDYGTRNDYERQSSLSTLPSSKHPHLQLDRRRTASESQLSAKKDLDAKKQPSSTLPSSSLNINNNNNTSSGCNCHNNGGHYNHTVMDQMYHGSIEKVYNILSNRSFLQKFLTEIEKNTEVDIGPWQKGESVHSERAITYIKPLSNAIGPRSTKCILKEQVHHMDVENYVTQVITTQTPDVPSGSSFCVKTRICIMRAGQGKVRVLVTMIVEFIKSSWLKSTIEKACIDGQINYYKGIDTAIRKYIQQNNEQHPKQHRQHRRRRQRSSHYHPSNKHEHHHHQRQQQEEDQKINKKMYNGIMKLFSTGIDWVLQNRPPSTQQLMLICMMLLILINLYIASKMNYMSDKLIHQQQRQDYFSSPLSHWEEWTTTKEKETTDNESQPLMISSTGLNRQIIEIEKMIQQAGQNIDQVSKVVQQQQRMMIHHPNEE